MKIKIAGTPEEIKKLLAELAGKEFVTKEELEKVLADYAKFAKPKSVSKDHGECKFNWAKGCYGTGGCDYE